MIRRRWRFPIAEWLNAAAAAAILGALALGGAAALAQTWPQNPGASQPPGPIPAPAQSPVCQRLEAQLSAIDRGSTDPARAEQIRRYEDAAGKQQFELDRSIAQARRSGCEGTGFFLFGGQPPQCDALNAQIQRMRGNLARITMDLQRLQSGNFERGDQRRAVLVALTQNDCGPQYRAAAPPPRQRGFLESLFGAPSESAPSAPDFANPDSMQAGGHRTICVRTCDGYYFPISFATSPERFQDDERTCQRMCPAAEVVLFSHRNPGEDVSQAVSLGGRSYRELPNAFRYRSEFNPACSCKRQGQSWAEAMGEDSTIERGDIVVTEERAKALSQPRPEAPRSSRQDARRKGASPSLEPPPAATAPAPAAAPSAPAAPAEKRSVRTVGPSYYPPR